ncbi:hypothetical protein NPIL_633981 [Nephila pilipes]|uniref:C2H2-type domain-containing protein n=2 Tax=Nephila pilipes TaxID=299642 RepID=A0A8X6PW82_NEPPI|nr:hypothetical protein NPIL_198271 [Nephila pilipes]GFT92932.1 hypothetical protein NPIL_633981 [Nephila pilipes]
MSQRRHLTDSDAWRIVGRMECAKCKQVYETQRELSIHSHIHSSCDELSFPVFELRHVTEKKTPILEDFRSMTGRFDFPVVKEIKHKIPSTEVSKTNSSKVTRGILNASRCDNVNSDEIRYGSTKDSGNYSSESTGLKRSSENEIRKTFGEKKLRGTNSSRQIKLKSARQI